MTRFILALSLAFGFASTNAFAAKKKKQIQIPDVTEFIATEKDDSLILNDEHYQKGLKERKTSNKRSISQEKPSIKKAIDIPSVEATFPKDFIELRAKLIGLENRADQQSITSKGIDTPERLDEIIREYSQPAVYSKLSPMAKMVAIQLKSLVPYKSFFFRAQKYLGSGTALRSAVVTMLRNSNTGIRTFFAVSDVTPVNHWNVIFKYMTEPMSGMGSPIANDMDLQRFVGQLIKDTRPLIKDMEALYSSTESLYWDNRLYMAFANFTSEKDRYVQLGKPEMETILAGATAGFSSLLATGAYSFIGLSEATRVTSAFFGMEQVSNQFNFTPKSQDKVMGLKSSERFQILRQYPYLFVRAVGGQDLMKESHENLLKSIRYSRWAWEKLDRLGNDSRDQFLFDPRAVLPFNRILTTNFNNAESIVAGKEVASTVIDGELVKINIYAIYHNSPQRLSDFYPVAFKTGSEYREKKIDGTTYKDVRNYDVGSPLAWNRQAYEAYFPDLDKTPCPTQSVVRVNECTAEVGKYSRILTQTWGTAGVGAMLAGMVF